MTFPSCLLKCPNTVQAIYKHPVPQQQFPNAFSTALKLIASISNYFRSLERLSVGVPDLRLYFLAEIFAQVQAG